MRRMRPLASESGVGWGNAVGTSVAVGRGVAVLAGVGLRVEVGDGSAVRVWAALWVDKAFTLSAAPVAAAIVLALSAVGVAVAPSGKLPAAHASPLRLSKAGKPHTPNHLPKKWIVGFISVLLKLIKKAPRTAGLWENHH